MLTEFPLDKKSISRLASNGLALEVLRSQIDEALHLMLEVWRAQGLNIIKKHGYYFFETKFTPIDEAEFCIVDIETNGSKIERHQIIEIAAIKVKNGKIIDRFESLVQCERINPIIVDLTGITIEDTKDAPPLQEVLYQFHQFLGDAIFVAHDVKFDYTFISSSFEKVGLPPMLNRSLCSLALAERTIVSYRYSLSYLSKTLHLNPNATHHRAMSDVMTTYELFLLSLKNCDKNLHNVEDLIKFSKEAPRLKRPKFDPFLKEEENK
ncbi:DNA polymerase III epsilon subunit [hydrothermal vent metagenome]|uniref:DNA polymerase III epsilon subunit n=1 Tax=hydrothermal vent metagenome TaxID=652676 RepID=A0A1W1D224_9ZZZZ